MAIVTVRVDPETKARMARMRHINWSAVLRERIHEVVAGRGARNPVKALLMTQRLSRKPAPGFDSSQAIRSWRENRYGPRRARR